MWVQEMCKEETASNNPDQEVNMSIAELQKLAKQQQAQINQLLQSQQAQQAQIATGMQQLANMPPPTVIPAGQTGTAVAPAVAPAVAQANEILSRVKTVEEEVKKANEPLGAWTWVAIGGGLFALIVGGTVVGHVIVGAVSGDS